MIIIVRQETEDGSSYLLFISMFLTILKLIIIIKTIFHIIIYKSNLFLKSINPYYYYNIIV